jgi:glycosyltransferase involved in cell wall biosynthesis
MLDALAAHHPDLTLLPIGGLTPFRRRATFLSAAVTGRPRLDRLTGERPTVVWAPAPAPMAVSADLPFVLTVHDLSWVERPSDFTPYERLWHHAGRLRRLARRADRVVVDAHAMVEPVSRWGVEADRIRVVHPGIPERPIGRLPEKIAPGFVLFVGALEPRKDPELLLEAYRRSGLDCGLVFAGTGRLATKLEADATVIHPATDELGALYAHARVLVLPSHLEGFGFPPLEAANAGTPSIVSDLPVLRETLGDAATFIRSRDPGAWAEALRTPPPHPKTPRFTWEDAGMKLRAVFEEVAR